jgi:hypothetical protein
MNKLLIIFPVIIILTTFTRGQNGPYQAGEKVSYIIHYGLINGGIASLELKNDSFAGQELLHSVLAARTTGLADALFKVRDSFESYINPEDGLPVKSIRDVSEGRYKRYNVVLFDHATRQDSAILKSNLTGIHITQPGIHDILSCFYYFRKHFLATKYAFKKDEIITIMTWFTDELYPIRLKYIGTDEVRTRAGKLKCLRFNPVSEVGRLFKTEEDVTLWFSADKNYLPVKARFDIFVGAFTVDLIGYEGLKDTLNIKLKKN